MGCLSAALCVATALLGCAPDGRRGGEPLDPSEAGVADLSRALEEGRVTSEALVARSIERIEAYDRAGPELNAVAVVHPQALERARALDAERRESGARGPLHGIPVIVKDNYETRDMPTTAGSRTLAGWAPDHDAYVVRRLREAGAVVLAKANMHEFAYGITTVGSLFGATRNPYAPGHNPGGSSGGTGAAVAAGLATVGMGTDTCGSVRIPAAHNALVGLRGTQGLVSRAHVVPLSLTQDIAGPLGRSVADVAVVMDAIAGYDPEDPQTAAAVGHMPGSYADALDAGALAGARLGLLTDWLGGEPEAAAVSTVIRRATGEMAAAGAEVVELTLPAFDALYADDASAYTVLVTDFRPDIDRYLGAHPNAPVASFQAILDSGDYHPAIEPSLQASAAAEGRDGRLYLAHLAKRGRLREAILDLMARRRLDALVYPTIRRPAAPVGEPQLGSNCFLAANSGLPAITVPAGFTPEGLPVGVELLGRAWGEPRLLALAYAYEQATGHRRPPESTPPLP